MGLSTHVLDTAHGCPAAGMLVTLERWQANQASATGSWRLVKQVTLNADGRNPDGLLIATADMQLGRFQLVFEVGQYFRSRGVVLPQHAFLESVPVVFGIADVASHYHVPLLCSPYGFSTYRGS